MESIDRAEGPVVAKAEVWNLIWIMVYSFSPGKIIIEFCINCDRVWNLLMWFSLSVGWL